jgi:hypothetical protein
MRALVRVSFMFIYEYFISLIKGFLALFVGKVEFFSVFNMKIFIYADDIENTGAFIMTEQRIIFLCCGVGNYFLFFCSPELFNCSVVVAFYRKSKIGLTINH